MYSHTYSHDPLDYLYSPKYLEQGSLRCLGVFDGHDEDWLFIKGPRIYLGTYICYMFTHVCSLSRLCDNIYIYIYKKHDTDNWYNYI